MLNSVFPNHYWDDAEIRWHKSSITRSWLGKEKAPPPPTSPESQAEIPKSPLAISRTNSKVQSRTHTLARPEPKAKKPNPPAASQVVAGPPSSSQFSTWTAPSRDDWQSEVFLLSSTPLITIVCFLKGQLAQRLSEVSPVVADGSVYRGWLVITLGDL